ncbi:MAG: hypothetical protein L0Z73_12110 [Gammaproteobacteria bacterium]|nr:hypothetical protein [Gammaproteobacteria bacterium]
MVTTRPKGLLNIPELSRPSPDSFDTRPKKINPWLQGLPLGDTGECARRIYHALREINRLDISGKDRWRILELITPQVLEINASLSRHYTNQMLPIPEKDQKVAALCIELYSELALGYKILIDQAWTKPLNFLTTKPMVSMIYRALYYLFQVLLTTYEIYIDPPRNTWMHIHQLYLFSEDNQLVGMLPRDINSKGNIPRATIGALYVQIALLGLLSPFRLRQTDTKKVVMALKDWSKHCSILPADLYEEKTGHVLIKQNSDYAPGFYFVDDTINHVYTRTLDTTALVDHIRNLVMAQSSGMEQNTGIYDLSPDVIRLLILTWGGKSKRLFSRTSKDNQLNVSVGINATHFMITNMQKLHTVLPEKGAYAELINSCAADQLTAFTGLLDKEEFRFESGAHFDVAPLFGISRIDKASTDVWDDDFGSKALKYSYNLKLSQQGKTRTPTTPHQTVHWDNLNESANGYCLFSNIKENAGSTKVQVGELIGMRNDNVKKEEAIDIGVIRRLKSTDKGIELGIQKLAPAADSVAICLYHHRNMQGKYQRALLLPVMKPRLLVNTLVTGKSFKAGDEVLLNKYGFLIKIQLTKIVETTADFNQFEFNVQKVIGLESTQKVEQAKNFDSVWTLI